MSGASSRSRGHGWEVRCARELSAVTGLDVRTTRALGASFGADVATVLSYDAHGRPVESTPKVLGWSIECKKVLPRDRNPAGWLRQARDQAAPGTTPVVLWSRKHYPFAKGSAFLYDDEAARGWVEVPISEWVEHHLMKETDDGASIRVHGSRG